jgi:hypothetical protein
MSCWVSWATRPRSTGVTAQSSEGWSHRTEHLRLAVPPWTNNCLSCTDSSNCLDPWQEHAK